MSRGAAGNEDFAKKLALTEACKISIEIIIIRVQYAPPWLSESA
jgi:hypothetical protein